MKKASPDYIILFTVSLAVFLGGVVRFYPVLLSHYPINDGGLFFTMVKDLLSHNFALPVYTSYNGNGIPFGYPPLPFYLLASIQKFLHIDVLDQVHYLPALFSTISIPVFYFLSRSITGSKERSVFAVFAYALMPHSYLWLIMGGGVTRALGVFFAILALYFVWEMFRNPSYSSLALSIIGCSLVVYTHPGIAWFVFITSLLIGVHHGVSKKVILYAFLTGMGVLAVTSPWWVTMLRRFGPSLFVNAAQTSGPIDPSVILFHFTGEPFITFISVVALLGLLAEVIRGRFFLLVWLILITFISPRGGPRLAALPGAMLFGSGVTLVIIPGLVSFARRVWDDSIQLAELIRERITKLALGIMLFAAFFSALAIPLLGLPETNSLSQDDYQAMAWISQNAPITSQFAVVTGEQAWRTDPVTEWFPALTGRISVTTVQGSEWLPGQTYKQKIAAYSALQACSTRDYSCILSWATQNATTFSYLYITRQPKGGQNTELPISFYLKSSDQLQLTFDNPSVSIYKVLTPP